MSAEDFFEIVEAVMAHIAYTGGHLPEVSNSAKTTLRFSWKMRSLWLVFALALLISFAVVADQILVKVIPVMLPVKEVIVFLLRVMLAA